MSGGNERTSEARRKGTSRAKHALVRDIAVPGLLGVLLNVVSFYEAGLNAVPLFNHDVFAPIARLSQAYFGAGPMAVLLAAAFVGAISSRAPLAWASFFVPSFLARLFTGTVLFIRGEANMWPVFLVGDVALGLTALLVAVFAAWLRARIAENQSI